MLLHIVAYVAIDSLLQLRIRVHWMRGQIVMTVIRATASP